MAVTQLTCPGCGAPAPATGGSCAWCGSTLQVAQQAPVAQPGGAAGGGPGRGPATGGVTVVLHGIDARHVMLLAGTLDRPRERMAEVPTRRPPAVYNVPPNLVPVLKQRLEPLGVRVEVAPDGPQGPGPRGPRGPGGPGPMGPPGFRGPRGPGGFGRR